MSWNVSTDICSDSNIINITYRSSGLNETCRLGQVSKTSSITKRVVAGFFWPRYSVMSNIIMSDSSVGPGGAGTIFWEIVWMGWGLPQALWWVSAVICSRDSHMTFAGSTSEMEPRKPRKNESLVPLVFPCLTLLSGSDIPALPPSGPSSVASLLCMTHSSTTKASRRPSPPLCLIPQPLPASRDKRCISCRSCWCSWY